MILGIGNALVDQLIADEKGAIISHLKLAKGGMTLVDEQTYCHIAQRSDCQPKSQATGGSAANAMLCAAAMGAKASFVGKVGDDALADFFEGEQREQNLLPQLVRCDVLPTGVASTFVASDGERSFATFLGAAATLRADELSAQNFAGASHVFVEGYLVQNHDLMRRILQLSKAAGAKLCIDLAAWNIVAAERAFFAELLAHADIVFANLEEAAAMTQLPASEAIDALAELAPLVVVKLGAEGAVACCEGKRTSCAAVPVSAVVDTTGAGDFFAGAFLHALSLGKSLQNCLEAGASAASAVIQVWGTKLSAETWAVLRQRG